MSDIRKVYLFPKHMRLGQPCLQYVTQEKAMHGPGYTYWLGIAHGEFRFSKKTNGSTLAYGNSSKVTITEEFFNAFVEEAKRNAKRFSIKKKVQSA